MISRLRAGVRLAWLAALAAAGPAAAQSITAGALKGTVRAADGSLMPGAAVTVETSGGGTFRNLQTRDDGSFEVRLMLPGTYSVLVELEGFQPIRLRGVVVAAGRTTIVSAVITERPPPITSVTEINYSGVSSGAQGRVIAGPEISLLDRRRDGADIFRDQGDVVTGLDARGGWLATGGLLPRWSRLFVDGAPEPMLYHPGVPAAPVPAPAFQRESIDQGQLMGSATDVEWRGVPGGLLGLQTRRGEDKLRFTPFASWSGSSLGGRTLDNPGDSSATSIQAGATISGALKPDTAHFLLAGSYQSLETPSSWAWERDTARYAGQPVSLREAIPQIGTSQYGLQLGGAVAPAVRTWKGGSGLGRLDWQLSANSAFMLRVGFASWKETNPALGMLAGNDAGGSVKGRDLSMALSLLSTGRAYSNDVRVGLATARREWTRTGVPATVIVGGEAAFGADAALPGLFETRTMSFSDAIRYDQARHSVKGGLSIDYTSYTQDYTWGSGGVFQFGGLDQFGAGQGDWFQATSSAGLVKFNIITPGLFLEDVYAVSSGLRLLAGLRWETQVLPKNKVTLNRAWADQSGIATDSAFSDRRGIQPRFGFILDPGNRGTWVLQGELGLHAGGIDPAAFAEALAYDGSVETSRVLGSLTGYPAAPANAGTGPRLTLLTGDESYRAPRTFKADMGLTGSLGGGLVLRLAGGYHHTDYLLRRSDLNRVALPVARTQEGRPVYGTLVQQGGLVTSVPSSGRRFSNFDLVSNLAPNGYSDHYELTASLERRGSGPLALSASGTFARTRDNLVGLLQADPANQLNPFPEGVDGADWSIGRSDLDVPVRLAGTAEFSGRGRMPVTVAVRGRWRSGLPFTPGFAAGADVNGDLGGGNDPVTADAVPSLSGGDVAASCDGGATGIYAARNSCRGKGVGALDARLAIGLPVGNGPRLWLTVDAFNLVASATGIVDRAAVLINPGQSATTANNVLTLPYLANPRFGTLLGRRTEPRLVRFGLRMEY